MLLLATASLTCFYVSTGAIPTHSTKYRYGSRFLFGKKSMTCNPRRYPRALLIFFSHLNLFPTLLEAASPVRKSSRWAHWVPIFLSTSLVAQHWDTGITNHKSKITRGIPYHASRSGISHLLAITKQHKTFFLTKRRTMLCWIFVVFGGMPTTRLFFEERMTREVSLNLYPLAASSMLIICAAIRLASSMLLGRTFRQLVHRGKANVK